MKKSGTSPTTRSTRATPAAHRSPTTRINPIPSTRDSRAGKKTKLFADTKEDSNSTSSNDVIESEDDDVIEDGASEEDTDNNEDPDVDGDNTDDEPTELKKPSPPKKAEIELVPVKTMFGELNMSETSLLKGYFRKTLFKTLKFVTPNTIKHDSNQMKECYKICKCLKTDDRFIKRDGIVKLMEHCLMSKRNYIVGRLEEQIIGTYYFYS